MCLNSWERTTKRHPHKLSQGDFWVKRVVPNRPFSATKSLVYCFILPLKSRVKGLDDKAPVSKFRQLKNGFKIIRDISQGVLNGVPLTGLRQERVLLTL